ncbi:DUF680 domain-containing protein [Mesorhizobium sp. ES1-4]|uniref:DUF680 domain-containing protein n=1 Tax=Mesorhizobium sp. ES1-4 TaxID=2876627 RepID=UPI001CCCEFE4|nr:DUF680 domain-containing protein [Mesorhizobium sp. ES1-4]MBZ9796254.1 DUF680 domain-containing protein [Mesorhizobium sp. ES1-4]
MTKIALAATAMLIAASTAFAGSDKFGSDAANQPAATVDRSTTASTSKPGQTTRAPHGADRNLFGR